MQQDYRSIRESVYIYRVEGERIVYEVPLKELS